LRCLRQSGKFEKYVDELEFFFSSRRRHTISKRDWSSDVCSSDLDEYRMRSAEAIQKHWCLVFVAYSFVHLDCLPPLPTKGSLPIKTIGEACRQQAQALMQALILYAHEHLQLGQRVEDIFGYLFAKQQPVLAR